MTEAGRPAGTSNRFYKRASLQFPVAYCLEEAKSKKFLGTLTDISAAGGCLRTTHNLSLHSQIVLTSLPHAPLGFRDLAARVVRVTTQNGSNQAAVQLYGLEFLEPRSNAHAIQLLIERQSDLRIKPRRSPIRWVLFLGLCVTLPLSILTFLVKYPSPLNASFVIFLSLVAGERLWESYFTGKHAGQLESRGDWSLTAVTFYYIVMLQLVVLEFFLWRRWPFSWAVSLIGIFLVLTALSIRLWSMKTLGDQWAIHLAQYKDAEVNGKALIAKGPYRYVRHPLYAAYFLEIFGITLATNCFMTLIFAILVNIPMQVIRVHVEEQDLLSTLGDSYASYMSRVPRFFPRKRMKKVDDQRTVHQPIDFPDRRRSRRRAS